jgi:hypothetical protein
MKARTRHCAVCEAKVRDNRKAVMIRGEFGQKERLTFPSGKELLTRGPKSPSLSPSRRNVSNSPIAEGGLICIIPHRGDRNPVCF